MARRVIRCDVNNLLLAVIVVESVFLGWYFLGWLMAPPGMSPLPDQAWNETAIKSMKNIPVKVVKKEDADEAWTAECIATAFLVTGLVLFILQLVAIANLILGYLKQNFKPLYIWLGWFVLSTLFLLIVGIWIAVIADQWLPDTLLNGSHKTVVETTNSRTGKVGTVDVPDNMPKGAILEITKRMTNRINCFLGPLIFLKIVLGIYEIFAVLAAIRYFKSLQPAKFTESTAVVAETAAVQELQEKTVLQEKKDDADQEKEKLVEKA